jgi:hypothetical protein
VLSFWSVKVLPFHWGQWVVHNLFFIDVGRSELPCCISGIMDEAMHTHAIGSQTKAC